MWILRELKPGLLAGISGCAVKKRSALLGDQARGFAKIRMA